MIICSKILIFCHKIDSSSRIIHLIFSSTREFLPLHNNFVYLRAQRSFQIYKFQRRKTPIFDSTRERKKNLSISRYILNRRTKVETRAVKRFDQAAIFPIDREGRVTPRHEFFGRGQ